ncbi:hypothetical protein EV426DRAFT_707301 [Tirmania nivea]|nr:hypothetical protein EV426DRAFT_707301 [Tirmania nivea]
MQGSKDTHPTSPAELIGMKGKGKVPYRNQENPTPGPSCFPGERKLANIAPKPPILDRESPPLARSGSRHKRARVDEDSRFVSGLLPETYIARPTIDIQNDGGSYIHSIIPESNDWVDGVNISMADVDIMQSSAFLTSAAPCHSPSEAGVKPQAQTPLPFHLPFAIYPPPMIPRNPQIINPEAPEGGFCPTCHSLWNNLRESIMAFTFSQDLPHGTDVSGELLKSYFGLDYHWRQGHVPGV